MKIINAYSVFLFLAISCSLLGMETGQSSPQKSLILSQPSVSPRRNDSQQIGVQGSNKKVSRQIRFSGESQDGDENEEEKVAEGVTRLVRKDIPGEMMKVINDPVYNHFYLDSYPVTHGRMIEAVKQRVEDGSSFSGNFGVHADNITVGLENVTFNSKNHAKGLVACEKDPLLGSPGKNAVLRTSSNATYKSYTNNEVAGITLNNKDLCLKAVKTHLSDSPISEKKKVRTDTPEKLHIDSSKRFKLNESEAKRIETATNSDAEKREIVKATMNFNDPQVAKALKKFVKDGGKASLIVNKTALKGGKKLLSEMDDAGVKVYVSKDMQHAKLFVRRIGDNYYSTIGTNNTTAEGDSEINNVFGTQEKKFGEDMLKDQKKYIKQRCMPYKEALSLEKEKAEEKKSSAKKRKQPSGGRSSKKLPLKKQKK